MPVEFMPCDAHGGDGGGGRGGPQRQAVPLVLCDRSDDGECIRFLRLLILDDRGRVITTRDRDVTGRIPYTPAGDIVDCTECAQDQDGGGGDPSQPCPDPEPACTGFASLGGGDVWTLPPHTESVSFTLLQGAARVWPCMGGDDEDGAVAMCVPGTVSWSASQTSGCTPRTLCDAFQIEMGDGASGAVSWVSYGCGDDDDESLGEES